MSHLQILPAVSERVDPLVFRFLDMREKLRWMMEMGGERVLLYKRMWEGERCSEYDPVRRQHRQDGNDTICFGTGFTGGYYGPFEIYVSIVTNVKQQFRIYEEGIKADYTATHWALWEPLLHNKDFIVRRNNQRLWINSVQQTKWRHHLLRQPFETTEVERSHPIYKLPIDGISDDPKVCTP